MSDPRPAMPAGRVKRDHSNNPLAKFDWRPLTERLSQYATVRRALRVVTAAEFLKLPLPTWLVDGVLERNSLSVLYGAAGCGKSFIALDLAMHIATGRPWMGKPVQQGQVIYVAAEGYQSLARRVKAWLDYYEMEPPENICFVLEPVDISGGVATLEQFIEGGMSTLPETRPRFNVALRINPDGPDEEYLEEVGEDVYPDVELIIFDTMARCCLNTDENDARDMGNVIRWLDLLRDKQVSDISPAVMLVHHTSKDRNMERGSTALRGAADTMMYVKMEENGPLLRCSKQKSDVDFADILFAMHAEEDREALVVPRSALMPTMSKAAMKYAETHAPKKERQLGPAQLSLLLAIGREAKSEQGIRPVDLFNSVSNKKMQFSQQRIYAIMADLKKYELITGVGYSRVLLTPQGVDVLKKHEKISPVVLIEPVQP